MTLNMLIMGPAGAGKGTMSELIEKKYNVAHISTGDMFRNEIKNNTELGQKATEYIKQGLLVPDEVTIAMVLKRMSQDDCNGGYLLDGFPRSLVQADVFDTKVIETSKEVNIVINLTVDKEALFDRIVNRRICKQCGAVYNIHTLPPKVEGVCDVCGGELYQRADDNRESLERRMQSYEEETAPVLTHYRRLNLVHDVNASQTIEEVWADVQAVIDGFIAEHQEEE